MNKTLSLAFLTGGIVLSIIAYAAYDASSFDISRFFTVSVADKSTWLLACGGVGTVLGAFGLSGKPKLR